MVIASLLIACGTSGEPATATVEPTSTPEPSTATPLPAESQEIKSSSQVPRISAEELKERLDNGEEIVIVDSRGKSSYDRKHIAGAIVDSSASAESPLDSLPLDQEIVFYCA
jgi:hypothetical protein